MTCAHQSGYLGKSERTSQTVSIDALINAVAFATNTPSKLGGGRLVGGTSCAAVRQKLEKSRRTRERKTELDDFADMTRYGANGAGENVRVRGPQGFRGISSTSIYRSVVPPPVQAFEWNTRPMAPLSIHVLGKFHWTTKGSLEVVAKAYPALGLRSMRDAGGRAQGACMCCVGDGT